MHSLGSRLLEAEEAGFEVWKLVTILMLSQALEFGGRLPRDDILPPWNQFTSVNLAWRNNWNCGWCVYVLLQLWMVGVFLELGMVCVCALGTADGVCMCFCNCGWCVYVVFGSKKVFCKERQILFSFLSFLARCEHPNNIPQRLTMDVV